MKRSAIITVLAALVLPIAATTPLLAQHPPIGIPYVVDIPNGPNVDPGGDPFNLDAAIFSVSTFDESRGRAVYFSAQNNRIMVNFQQSDGSWLYPTSQVAVEMPDPSTIALGVVFSAPTPDLRPPGGVS